MKKKNLIIIIVCLLVAVAGIVTANILIKPKEEKTPTENKVDVIKKTSVLETADPAKAAELIKENIVKITNEVKGVKVTGTGFFHESGYLVTNSHVVDLKGTIKVTYNDGTETEATLVSNDMTSDIAILSVEKQKVLALTFGNTLNLKVTDELYAIGYPFALEGEATTTKGILSARRSAGGIEYLQTDMSLNTGNSGGPLINAKAEVFGMTTYATENASLGMSISAESLESIIQKLIDKKETKYLEDDRETNALSTVLTEIGHKDEDIYDEKERLDKVFDREPPKVEEPEKPVEVKPVVKKSGDNSLKELYVNGKKIDIKTYDSQYHISHLGAGKALDIKVVPNHSKATVRIQGNRDLAEGEGTIVNIFIKAENGKEKCVYDLKVSAVKTTIDNIHTMETYANLTQDYETNVNVFEINVNFRDRDGLETYGTYGYVSGPIRKVEVTASVINTPTARELKKYTFNADGRSIIKVSEIRSMLNEEDYNGQTFANLKFDIKVTTYSQGSYTSSTETTINK